MKRKKTADKRRQEIITEKRKAARIQTRPEIEMLAVDRLVPYAKNAKKHNDRQVAAIAGSIREFGFTNPVLIDGQDGIIAGHGRVLGARLAGVAEVPCIRLAHLTDAQRRAYILADNRLAETGGGWDAAMLAVEVEAIDWAELESFGLDDMDLDEILAEAERGSEGDADAEPQVDRAEELNKNWGVKAGDLWLIGRHRLVCGDSTSAENMARLMDDAKATLVFTDPPYGVSIGKKNEMLNTFQKAGRCLTSLDADDMKPEELKRVLLAAFTVCRPHLADDCSVFVCSPQGGGLGMMMMMMMQEACLEVRHILNWVKNSPTFSMGRLDYDYQHEPILFTWTKTHKKRDGGQFHTSLWQVDKPRACKLHPTMKPVEIPVNAILNHTDAGDVVLDMFGGSGTTMVAAANTGRIGCLSELSPNFCAVILQRMSDAFPGIEIRKADA